MDERQMIRETYRLAMENNRLLHKMRRAAFWHTFLTLIIYAVLLLAPVWFYSQYLSPIVNQLFSTMQQVQGTGAQAGVQLQSLQEAWAQLQDKFHPATTGTAQ